MREMDLIRALRQHLRVSPDQRNVVFAADAEIVEAGGQTLAITVDEFSTEDGLSLEDPRLLGWNLVAATLSDLLAVGAQPRYMLNSLVATPGMDLGFMDGFSAGLQEGLDAFDAFMLGGDAGTGNAWRFMGVGVGTYADGTSPCSRLTALDRGVVMATGAFGDGNLSAGGLGPAPRFECRLAAARGLHPWLARGEVACIDTSDGLGSALETLAGLNDRLRIVIELDRVELADGAAEAAGQRGIRPETFLLASAGEYELLVLVPGAAVAELAAGTAFYPIGSFESGAASGLFYQRGSSPGSKALIRHRPLPDPRDTHDQPSYRDRIVAHAARLFGAGEDAQTSLPER